MKKKIGPYLFLTGLILLVYTGYNYLNNTEIFGFLGWDFIVSKGDITPVFVSAAIMVLGIIISSIVDRT